MHKLHLIYSICKAALENYKVLPLLEWLSADVFNGKALGIFHADNVSLYISERSDLELMGKRPTTS